MSVESDSHGKCRLCLAEINDNNFTPIFPQARAKGVSLVTKIMVCVSLTVREEDPLPKKICENCEKLLHSFYSFREACYDAYFTLMQNHLRFKCVDTIESQLASITGTKLAPDRLSNKRRTLGVVANDIPVSSGAGVPETVQCKNDSGANSYEGAISMQNPMDAQNEDSENDLEVLLSASPKESYNKYDTDVSHVAGVNQMYTEAKDRRETLSDNEDRQFYDVAENQVKTENTYENLTNTDESCATINASGHERRSKCRKVDHFAIDGSIGYKEVPAPFLDSNLQLTAMTLKNETDATRMMFTKCEMGPKVRDKIGTKPSKRIRVTPSDVQDKNPADDLETTKGEVDKKPIIDFDLEQKIPQHHIVCVNADEQYVNSVASDDEIKGENAAKDSRDVEVEGAWQDVAQHPDQNVQHLNQLLEVDVDTGRNSEQQKNYIDRVQEDTGAAEEYLSNTNETTLTTYFLDDYVEEDYYQVEEVQEQILHDGYIEQRTRYKCLQCENIFYDLDAVSTHYVKCCQELSGEMTAEDNVSEDSPDCMENVEYLDENLETDLERRNDGPDSKSSQISDSLIKTLQVQEDSPIARSTLPKLRRLNPLRRKRQGSTPNKATSLNVSKLRENKDQTDRKFLTETGGSIESNTGDVDVTSTSKIQSDNYNTNSNDSQTNLHYSDVEHDSNSLISNKNADDSSKCDEVVTNESVGNANVDPRSVSSVRSKRRKGNRRKTDHSCPECAAIFGSASMLKRHSVVHTGERPHVCEICDRRFAQIGQLNFHRNFHQNPRYRCEICNKPFLRPSDVEKHMRTHTGEKPFDCKICSKSFAQLIALQQHERIHTGAKPYGCEICGKKFSQKANKTKHLKIHKEGERPHTCDVCGRSFSELKEMELHKAGHGGGRPRKCDFCKESFRKLSELTHHIRRFHTFEKPHECMFCPKAFYSLFNLKQHVMVHTGQKPFACPKCDLRFIQKGNLSKHFERKHPECVPEKEGFIVVSGEAYEGEDVLIVEGNVPEQVENPLTVEREETVELGEEDDTKKSCGNIQILAVTR